MRLARAALAVLAVLVWPGTAWADLELSWTAPAGCPDQAAVVASVQRAVATTPPEALRVAARVRAEEEQWVVDLELSGAASGTRSVRARTCRALARATALIVALALDPQARVPEEPIEEPAPPPPPPPKPEPPPPPPPPPVPVAPSVRPYVFAGATGERGLLPGFALGATFGGGLAWRIVRGDVAGQIVPTRGASLEGRSGGGDLSLLGLALRGCTGPSTRLVALAGCVRLRGARIAAEGAGLAPDYRQTAWLLALEPGALVRLPAAGGLAAELEAAAVVPLSRPDLVVLVNDVPTSLFRPAAVGVRVGLGATYRF